MISLRPNHLCGSIPPLVTPFKNGEVDYATYARLVERQIAGGSHGVLVNGTTSEPSTLTIEERNKLVEVAVNTASGRAPVVAATGSPNHPETPPLSQPPRQATRPAPCAPAPR